MNMTIDQLSLSQWPLGLDCDAAYVDHRPADLTSNLGIGFQRDIDDLGDFDAAILVMDDGTTFALQHHRHAPVSGTKILLKQSDFNLGILTRVLRALDIGRNDVLWKNPRLQSPVALPIIPRTKPAAGTGLILKVRKSSTANRRKKLLPRADRPRRPLQGKLTGRHSGHRA